MQSLDNNDIDNVAVTDVIPACFEIENPRLNPEREFSWIKDKAEPDYMDIRDDRVTYFTNVTAKPNTIIIWYGWLRRASM